MEVFVERCLGLYVHSGTIVACIIMGKKEEEMFKETETFPKQTKDLFRLLKWIEDNGVAHIAMESTGVYGKPVFKHFRVFFHITLANAQRIKNVPGEKQMYQTQNGLLNYSVMDLLEKSFVPPIDIRELRDLTQFKKVNRSLNI